MKTFKMKIYATVAAAFFATAAVAQVPTPPPYSVLAGAASISVTSASSRVALPSPTTPYGAVTVYNKGTVDAFFALGGSSVTATASSTPIAAGTYLTLYAGSNTHVAAITASSITSIVVYQGSGPIQFGKSGSGGGAPAGPAGGVLSGTYPDPGFASVADQRLLGNVSGGVAAPVDLTQTEVLTFLGGTSGTGALLRQTSPSLVSPALGAATATSVAIGAGSAITSSGPGGSMTSLGFTAPGTGVVTALGNAAGGAGGFALVGTTPPTGSAGGSLSGTYPNPSLAAVNSIATSLAVGGATIGSDALAWNGSATGSGRLTIGGITNTANGAASAPSQLFSGTLFSGGSGTTTFPQILIQPSGTTAATTWSTSGTVFGANVASGFAGNFLDFHASGGTSVFNISSAGMITAQGGATINGNSNFGAGGFFVGSGSNTQIWNGGTYAWSATSAASGSADTFIGRQGAASIRLGAADAASPIAQTLRVQSAVGGTSNANGANWTQIASLATGSGISGDYIFQTGVSPGGGSPTVQATPTTALTIKGETQSVVVASGKAFQLGNAYVNTPAVSTGYLLISDSNGAVYKIPACLASGC